MIHEHTHTRGGEEGPGQPVVGGDFSDLSGNIDESTNHWRDPVKAQQSKAEQRRETKADTNIYNGERHKKD